jgi:hypothetical protein
MTRQHDRVMTVAKPKLTRGQARIIARLQAGDSIRLTRGAGGEHDDGPRPYWVRHNVFDGWVNPPALQGLTDAGLVINADGRFSVTREGEEVYRAWSLWAVHSATSIGAHEAEAPGPDR